MVLFHSKKNMLSLEPSSLKQGGFQLAHSLKHDSGIYVQPGSSLDPPSIINTSPLDLLTDTDWMKAISKYKVSKNKLAA